MSNNVKLSDLVSKIKENDLVLPDFQRNFVWNEDQMKGLFSSVLCQMPIGSILLLNSSEKTFACKPLGGGIKTQKLDLSSGKDFSFLLDGQQRLTSLFAGFTTYYFTEYKGKFNTLSSKDLISLFMIKIPSSTISDFDLFSSHDLSFDVSARIESKTYFDSSSMLEIVDAVKLSDITDERGFAKNFDITNTNHLQKIIEYCTKTQNGFYHIPLQFVGSTIREVTTAYKKILKTISTLCDSGDDSDKEENWRAEIDKYLTNCVNSIELNSIVVDNSNKARAIDIYSNLNIGGVKLDVFDLIMAKLGSVSDRNFYERISELIQDKTYTYPDEIFPQKILTWIKTNNIDYSNASKYIGVINSDGTIERSYINVFLNTLGLYIAKIKDKEFDPNVIKQDKLLDLDASDVDHAIDTICTGMDRAILFFQTRCGIRKIGEINYKAEFAVIAYFFCFDEYFNNPLIHDFFEYWYWISLFSWRYPSNQNIKILEEIPKFHALFDNQDSSILNNLKQAQEQDVLKTKHYSDEDILTMCKVDETDKVPLPVMTKYICQFYLSYDGEYKDLSDEQTLLNGLYEPDIGFDIHHIRPLGSTKKLGQLTRDLRGDKKNPYNSPLNMLYITKAANKRISDMDFDKYSSDPKIKNSLSLVGCNPDSFKNDNDIQPFLKARFNDLSARLGKQLSYLQSRVEQLGK